MSDLLDIQLPDGYTAPGNTDALDGDGNAFAIMGRVDRALRRAGNDPSVVTSYVDQATAGRLRAPVPRVHQVPPGLMDTPPQEARVPMILFVRRCEQCENVEERTWTDSWSGKELCQMCLGTVIETVTNSPGSEGDNLQGELNALIR